MRRLEPAGFWSAAMLWTLTGAAFASAALVPPASAIEPGTIVLSLEATSGTADLVSPGTYLSAFDHGEVGLQVQAWLMMDESYAWAVSGGVARTREANRAAGQPSRYYQQRAWSARVGPRAG